ncbi:hypothetical protein ABIC09_000863 [Bradyrhizobium sp. S3.12.5]|uniref:hypothetical protein n=1 Tax=Bradyrhizobium sp. S3.12.5 TaxID=3156386 RepID=UPI00339B8A54
MILTVTGLAGQPGGLGNETASASAAVWSYSRLPLVTLTSLAATMAAFGIAGVGWHLANSNAAMALVSLLIAATGFYLFLGTQKELSNLEFLASHAAKLNKLAKDELLKQIIAENSNSIFRLVEALLRFIERTSSQKANRRMASRR